MIPMTKEPNDWKSSTINIKFMLFNLRVIYEIRLHDSTIFCVRCVQKIENERLTLNEKIRKNRKRRSVDHQTHH